MFWIENITLISGGILMKVLDVRPFQDGIQRNTDMLNRVEQEMQQIQKTISGLVALEDQLKGQGGNAIRAFYNDCHIPFLQFFTIFQTGFKERLSQMKLALEGLEPDPNGYIKQAFLEGEVEEGLTAISKITESLTDESNSIMDQVSDIVALPHLNDSEVQQGVNDSRKKRNLTVSDLCEFDMTQKNNLLFVEKDLLSMEQWLLDIEGMMNDGLSDIDFQADVWKDYTREHPLQTELDTQDPSLEQVEDKDQSNDANDVANTKSDVDKIKEEVGLLKRINTATTGLVSSYGMYQAGKKGVLKTSRVYDSKTGKYTHKIQANGEALKHLKVVPDAEALKDFNKGLPKGDKKWSKKHHEKAINNTTDLKYATKKPNSSGWSTTGDEALKKHPNLAYWNDKATSVEKAKTVGIATAKGIGKSFKDIVDIKGMAQPGLKGVTKALGPIGAAANYFSNYNTAKSEGLSGGKAAARATVDTAVETAVGGAVQTAFTVGFTVAIPFPGVGTAVGVGLGIVANMILTSKFGGEKSAMDHIKGWFR